jgi:serine/threonine-protein kinase
VKARHTYPSGQTPASRLKALLACLEAEKGAAAAEAWLAEARLARKDLDDETRLLPLAALHSGLKAFLAQLPDGLDRAAPFFAARENLGAWVRVLRGTRAPEEAFGWIEASDSEHGRTTRWETLEARPGRWRGRVVLRHDPKLEADGLLARARALELSVVPTLFGFDRGSATLVAKSDDAQEFEARWSVPTPLRGLAPGALAGLVAGAGAFAVHPSAPTIAAALVTTVAGSAAGLAWSRGQTRSVEAKAQAVRVSALERSLALRERESEVSSGGVEGTVIAGQYRIGERMGTGASGVIYDAMRIADGLPVAIKLLRAATAHDVSASDRLRRESEALGLSWHPNVVEVIDHGHLTDGTSYLVMELLRGETLATRLEGRVRISARELLPIATQMAEALVAIHAAGVVHRDLKPSNIYLVPDPEAGPSSERVKVLDFGIARVEWEEMRITNMGAPLGTPGYMSPEQERGLDIDHRSDIYAAGAVLYECLVGEPPPASSADMWKPGTTAPSAFEIRLGAGEGLRSGVQPASAAVDAPPAWRALIERALAKEADQRFQDARALLAAVRALEAREEAPSKTADLGRADV